MRSKRRHRTKKLIIKMARISREILLSSLSFGWIKSISRTPKLIVMPIESAYEREWIHPWHENATISIGICWNQHAVEFTKNKYCHWVDPVKAKCFAKKEMSTMKIWIDWKISSHLLNNSRSKKIDSMKHKLQTGAIKRTLWSELQERNVKKDCKFKQNQLIYRCLRAAADGKFFVEQIKL